MKKATENVIRKCVGDGMGDLHTLCVKELFMEGHIRVLEIHAAIRKCLFPGQRNYKHKNLLLVYYLLFLHLHLSDALIQSNSQVMHTMRNERLGVLLTDTSTCWLAQPFGYGKLSNKLSYSCCLLF